MYICFSGLLSYDILVGDMAVHFLSNIGASTHYLPRAVFVVLFSAVFMPLSQFRNLKSLRYSSFIGITASVYVSLLIISQWIVAMSNGVDSNGNFHSRGTVSSCGVAKVHSADKESHTNKCLK